MKIVPAAAHAGWHVPLKIFKNSIHPSHCCVLKHAFLRRAITASIAVISAGRLRPQLPGGCHSS